MRIRALPVIAAVVLFVCALAVAQPKYSEWSTPVNLGAVVNSPYQDFAPALSKDGLSLYFSSDRGGNPDLWVSERATKEDAWGEPQNLGPVVNSPYSDNSAVLSRDEHWLFFSSSRPEGAIGGFQDIWASWREDTHDNFAWGPPFNLGTGVNSKNADVFPSYFENEERGAPLLFFSSNRPGGPGTGMHIYVSELQSNGDFGPATAVAELMTGAGMSESRPSIRFDGLEIFFFRNPNGRATAADVWVSTRRSVTDSWSAPLSLGPIVNSPFQDSHPFIAPDRETLYFCSDRDHPGNLDLYMAMRTKQHP